MKSLGTPIANDVAYGGKILNDGKGKEDSEEWKEAFEGCYENEDEGGTQMFMTLWLHAYRYRFKDIEV